VQKPDAYMVTVIKEPVKQTSLADIIIGSFGITGILFVASLALGVIVAVVRVGWNRRHRPEDDRLPHISPLVR
jgi:hypothetical protein